MVPNTMSSGAREVFLFGRLAHSGRCAGQSREFNPGCLPHLQAEPLSDVCLNEDGSDMLQASRFKGATILGQGLGPRAREAIELDRQTSAATLKFIRSFLPLESEEIVLPPFIIEQIRRREEEERRRDQPRLELPVDAYPPRSQDPGMEEVDDEGPERGVVILDL